MQSLTNGTLESGNLPCSTSSKPGPWRVNTSPSKSAYVTPCQDAVKDIRPRALQFFQLLKASAALTKLSKEEMQLSGKQEDWVPGLTLPFELLSNKSFPLSMPQCAQLWNESLGTKDTSKSASLRQLFFSFGVLDYFKNLITSSPQNCTYDFRKFMEFLKFKLILLVQYGLDIRQVWDWTLEISLCLFLSFSLPPSPAPPPLPWASLLPLRLIQKNGTNNTYFTNCCENEK